MLFIFFRLHYNTKLSNCQCFAAKLCKMLHFGAYRIRLLYAFIQDLIPIVIHRHLQKFFSRILKRFDLRFGKVQFGVIPLSRIGTLTVPFDIPESRERVPIALITVDMILMIAEFVNESGFLILIVIFRFRISRFKRVHEFQVMIDKILIVIKSKRNRVINHPSTE